MTGRSTLPSTWVDMKLCLVGMLALLTAIPVFAQEEKPDFEVDIISTWSEDQGNGGSRVDVFTRIPYTNLSFINSSTGFTAAYEVKLDAISVSEDRFRNVVRSRLWDKNVIVNTYSGTQSQTLFDFTTQSIELDPGNYVFELSVVDKNGSQTMVREIPHEVKAFNGVVSISDIMLLESYDRDNVTIQPRIDDRVGSDEGGFQMFYEVYTEGARPIVVKQHVHRMLQDPSLVAAGKVIGEGMEGEEVYSKEEVAELPSKRSQYIVTVPIDKDEKVGMYAVDVTLSNMAGDVLDSSRRYFSLVWSGLDKHIENVDEAIAQLEYVAKARDMNFIKDAPNEVERIRRFRSFWEKRDPTPGTKRNEAMEEYYYRIASANENYGSVEDGWKTDRGLVLVRYGEPDHINRSNFSFDTERYEIWLYERIGRRFIFVDKSGFGDFELLVPVWDDRTRLY